MELLTPNLLEINLTGPYEIATPLLNLYILYLTVIYSLFLGVPFFDGVFAELGCSVEWLREEGEYLEPVTKVAIVKGEVRKILQGERLALNCLSRASGAATISKKLKDKATSTGWKGQIAGITPKK